MKKLFSFGKKQQSRALTAQQERAMILSADTGFHVTEAYKAVRTNTMFSLPGKGCKKIAVTSSFMSEGKSTTCINLAITFAQTGARVLILDADMRKPTIHRKLDRVNDKGLAHLLGAFCTLEEAIIHTEHDNLDIITSGHIPPNPAELLASEAMTELLAELEKQYDYIFIDTPPVNVVTDAAVLAQSVSGMIVVVRQDTTHHKEVQNTLERLEFAQAKILGFILHGVKEEKHVYGKYGKYGYSHYGYKTSPYVQESN